MIVGLGEESDPWESQQAAAWTPAALDAAQGAQTIETPLSTMTIYPATIGPAKVLPRTGPTKLLDKIMPKTAGPGGAVRIWGMPPAVAYTLAALVLGGAGWWAFREFGGGGGGRRREAVASNPRRRRRGRGRGRRSKR
ncbi:MAG TPA: hypothetical protein VFQ87_03120 [Bradyrhizobium sp.]|jgi:hypothetical protein|nr:hypothetical protein [Bradyrhizobium sp.]